jgi:hypothetical protein
MRGGRNLLYGEKAPVVSKRPNQKGLSEKRLQLIQSIYASWIDAGKSPKFSVDLKLLVKKHPDAQTTATELKRLGLVGEKIIGGRFYIYLTKKGEDYFS